MSAAAKRPSDTEDLSLCLTVSIALSRTLSGSTTLYNLHLISISKNHIFMSHALQALWWVCHYSVMKPGQRSLQDSAKVCQKAFHIPWISQKTNSLSQTGAEGRSAAGCAREYRGFEKEFRIVWRREKNVSWHQEKLMGFNARKKSISNNGRRVKWWRLRVRVHIAK